MYECIFKVTASVTVKFLCFLKHVCKHQHHFSMQAATKLIASGVFAKEMPYGIPYIFQ